MKHAPIAILLLLTAGGIGSVAGCNMVTGADAILLGPSQSERETDDDGETIDTPVEPSSAASGAGPNTGAGGNTSDAVSSSSSGEPTPPPPASEPKPADGVSLTGLDLYQGLRRPLMTNGAPASSDLPVVAGKDGLLRIMYATDASYNGQTVKAVVTIGAEPPIEVSEVLSGSSSQSDLGSSINVQIPGNIITVGAEIRVELLQDGALSSGGNTAATFQGPLEAEQGGKTLKITVVPVINGGKQPDTSAAQINRYKRWFEGTYPIPNVQITVRQQSISFNGNLKSYSGWSQLLNTISELRSSDGVSSDVYYYGVHAASSGGLAGLGWVGKNPSDTWSRSAIGLGFTGDSSAQTMIHEIGHNHGREHAPCGSVSSYDGNYPHAGAKLGTWGLKPWTNQLLSPNQTVDFMSYCDPSWVSDYTYKALFKRLTFVSSSPKLIIDPELLDRSYDAIRVLDGVAEWSGTITRHDPPMATPRSVLVSSPARGTRTVAGYYYPYDHITGGMLYIRRPKYATPADELSLAEFTAEGELFTLSK